MNQHVNLTAAARLDLPPEVVAAADRRAQCIPGADTMRSAWRELPGDVRDQIGAYAVAQVFYGRLAHDMPDCWLPFEVQAEFANRSDEALNAIYRAVVDAAPALCGTPDAEPAWACEAAEGLAVALHVGAEAEREFQTAAVVVEGRASPLQAAVEMHSLAFPAEMALLSPVQIAAAAHRQAWNSLQISSAFLDATGKADRKNLSWPAEEAEDEALTDLSMLSCRDRADATAMLAHLRWYREVRPQHPSRSALGEADGALIAVRLRDLGMILDMEVEGAVPAPKPGAMTDLLAAHRAAWQAYRTTPDHAETGWDAHFALTEALDGTVEAVLRAPCADRSEAAAFVEHVRYYSVELAVAGRKLTDGLDYEAKQLRARAGDLALLSSQPAA